MNDFSSAKSISHMHINIAGTQTYTHKYMPKHTCTSSQYKVMYSCTMHIHFTYNACMKMIGVSFIQWENDRTTKDLCNQQKLIFPKDINDMNTRQKTNKDMTKYNC